MKRTAQVRSSAGGGGVQLWQAYPCWLTTRSLGAAAVAVGQAGWQDPGVLWLLERGLSLASPFVPSGKIIPGTPMPSSEHCPASIVLEGALGEPLPSPPPLYLGSSGSGLAVGGQGEEAHFLFCTTALQMFSVSQEGTAGKETFFFLLQ